MYFNTFAGNPVAASRRARRARRARGRAAARARAPASGARLRTSARERSARRTSSRCADRGLLAGVQLGERRARRTRRSTSCARHGILVGRTGPDGNVLKIRPPLVFTDEHAELLVAAARRHSRLIFPSRSRIVRSDGRRANRCPARLALPCRRPGRLERARRALLALRLRHLHPGIPPESRRRRRRVPGRLRARVRAPRPAPERRGRAAVDRAAHATAVHRPPAGRTPREAPADLEGNSSRPRSTRRLSQARRGVDPHAPASMRSAPRAATSSTGFFAGTRATRRSGTPSARPRERSPAGSLAA